MEAASRGGPEVTVTKGNKPPEGGVRMRGTSLQEVHAHVIEGN